MNSVGGIALGLINIAIVVVLLILVGLLIKWFMDTVVKKPFGPQMEQYYLIFVGLIGLYMLIALLLGLPSVSIIRGSLVNHSNYSRVEPARGQIANPPPIAR